MNKAPAAVSPDADRAFYVQANEVLHQYAIPVIREAMVQDTHARLLRPTKSAHEAVGHALRLNDGTDPSIAGGNTYEKISWQGYKQSDTRTVDENQCAVIAGVPRQNYG